LHAVARGYLNLFVFQATGLRIARQKLQKLGRFFSQKNNCVIFETAYEEKFGNFSLKKTVPAEFWSQSYDYELQRQHCKNATTNSARFKNKNYFSPM
jgi:hypothetical protein